MTSTVIIEQVKLSASGKSLSVKASGRNYFAKKESGLMDKLGWTIEAETEESAPKDGGKPFVWITKWKKADAATASAPAAAPAPAAASAPAQQPSFSAEGINLAFLPFVSNCVAHAIQAGRIETPHDIQKWAQGAYSAANSLKDVPY